MTLENVVAADRWLLLLAQDIVDEIRSRNERLSWPLVVAFLISVDLVAFEVATEFVFSHVLAGHPLTEGFFETLWSFPLIFGLNFVIMCFYTDELKKIAGTFFRMFLFFIALSFTVFFFNDFYAWSWLAWPMSLVNAITNWFLFTLEKSDGIRKKREERERAAAEKFAEYVTG